MIIPVLAILVAIVAVGMMFYFSFADWTATPAAKSTKTTKVNTAKANTNTAVNENTNGVASSNSAVNTNSTGTNGNINASANTNVSVTNGNTNAATNTNTAVIAVSTTDWKAYSSSKRGYTFKYPPTWTLSVTNTYVLVEDPKGADGKFYVYPTTTPTVPSGDTWVKTGSTPTVGGKAAARTDYTAATGATGTGRSLIVFTAAPSGWETAHGLVLENGSADSGATPAAILGSWTFTK